MSNEKRDTNRPTVNLRVDAELAPRLNVGTRWEVVASSLESLWQGAYKVRLKEITAEDDRK
ncbi:MAG: hypothetical protein QNL88_02610 [Acidobacteriota bacterium]|nr:hypothetical protein [Acidobacteriota bacterium]